MAERQYEAVNVDEVEKLTSSERFIHKEKCGEGHPIHTFRIVGEKLEGRLRPCESFDRADRARTAEIHYYDAQGREAIVAIRLNKRLLRTVQDNRLWEEWVRITYMGSHKGKALYAEKVYQVEVDKGAITPQFQGVENEHSTDRKPRSPRKIRRPVAAAV